MSQYNSAGEGVKKLEDRFNYWGSKLEERSVQMAYGLIAANWVVHGSDGAIKSYGATASITLSVLFLAVHLVMTLYMAKMYGDRIDYSWKNQTDWENEFNERERTEWPHTTEIERLGGVIRCVRVWLPLMSGVVFILGILEVYAG